jgi:release factor glutamine methyltransferase
VNSKDDLKLQGEVIRKLNELNYPTPQPTSQDIITHCEGDQTKIDSVLVRLQNDEPIEYILGYAWFREREFIVNSSTLIPRQETEILVEESESIARNLLNTDNKSLKILDIGTGSGIIIISLEIALQDFDQRVKFYATDSSKEAVETARANELIFPEITEPRILFSRTDIIRDLEIDPSEHHIICANLPYIPTSDYLETQSSVLNYEPRTALDGGTDGLDLYKRLWNQIQAKGILSFILIAELHESHPTLYPQQMDKAFNTMLQHRLIKDQFGVERFIVSQPK